jgi:hypothetical protein
MVKRYALAEGSYDAGDHMSDDDESYRQAAAEDRYVRAADYDALAASREWQPISTAPKDHTDVLVWLRGNRAEQFNERAMVCRHDGYSGWCIPGVGGLSASHWMAAPSAPDAAVKQP